MKAFRPLKNGKPNGTYDVKHMVKGTFRSHPFRDFVSNRFEFDVEKPAPCVDMSSFRVVARDCQSAVKEETLDRTCAPGVAMMNAIALHEASMRNANASGW